MQPVHLKTLGSFLIYFQENTLMDNTYGNNFSKDTDIWNTE